MLVGLETNDKNGLTEIVKDGRIHGKGMNAARQSCEQGSTMGQDGYPTTVTPPLGSDPLSPRLEALRTLRHVAEQEWLAPYLRDGARDIATRIRKLKSEEIKIKNIAKSPDDITTAGEHTPEQH